MAGACAFAGVQWFKPGGVLPAVGYSAAGARRVATAAVGLGSGAAAAAADRVEGRLMRLSSQWFLAVEPIDLRCGTDRLLVWVQRSGDVASGSGCPDAAERLIRSTDRRPEVGGLAGRLPLSSRVRRLISPPQ